MPQYRVLRGTYRREDGTRAEPGDIIEISEDRRERLPRDSYERVEKEDDQDDVAPSLEEAHEPKTADEAEAEVSEGIDLAPDPDEAESEIEASGEVPDDYTVLSKMAKHYDGDEVHGSSSKEEMREFFGTLSDTEVASLKESAEAELAEE